MESVKADNAQQMNFSSDDQRYTEMLLALTHVFFINKIYRSVHGHHYYLLSPARPSIFVHLFRSISALSHRCHRQMSCDEKSAELIADDAPDE